MIVLPELQGRHLGRVAEQREPKVGGAGTRHRLNAQPILATAARNEGHAITPFIGAADDSGRRIEQRPTQIAVAGISLEKQPVTRLRLYRIQPSLRPLKLTDHRCVGLHRRGRVLTDQAKLVGTQRVADTVNIELIGAGLQREEAVTDGTDVTVVKQAGLALSQLPLHLGAIDPVKEEPRFVGDNKVVAVLFARLVDRTINAGNRRHCFGRQQKSRFQRFNLPLGHWQHRCRRARMGGAVQSDAHGPVDLSKAGLDGRDGAA